MPLNLLAFLASAARFLFGAALWCDATSAVMGRYPETRVPFVVTDVVVDAVVAGDNVIVVSGSGEHRRVVRSGRHGEVETLLDVEKRLVSGESLVAQGEHWWYGVTAVRDGVPSTLFVSDEGSSVVPASGALLVRWLPLRSSETPRALEVSFSSDGSPMATEINARGPLRSWHLPMMFSAASSAALLPDGRIAVVTQQKDSSHLYLFLLSNNERIVTVSLGYMMLLQLAIAVDGGSGRIVIAASTTDHRVVAASTDSVHPAEPVWRQLREGVRLSSYAREVQVVAVAGGAVASWVNRSVTPPRIEASNVYATHAPAEFRTIGPVIDRFRNTFATLRDDGGEPVWTWDDGSHLLMRRLPASIDGYVWLDRVAEWCGVRVRR